MDKAKLLYDILDETHTVIARGGRKRPVHKSPYKKSLVGLVDSISAKLVRDPSSKNMAAWVLNVLLPKTGITIQTLPNNEYVDEKLKQTIRFLKHVSVYAPVEVTNFLLETVRLAANNAEDQLHELHHTLRAAATKSKLSRTQMQHDQVGTTPVSDSLRSERSKKRVNTTGVI